MSAIEVTRTTVVPATLEEVHAYHEQPVAFERLSPPWRPPRNVQRSRGLEPGARTEFRSRLGPIPFTWVAEHVEHTGDGFTDVMVKGPFASWRHEHRFEPAASGTKITDVIRARLPFDPLVPGPIRRRIEREIDALLRYRHTVTHDDLADPRSAPLRVAITGASGLIGTRLAQRLAARGHVVVPLVRGDPAPSEVRWNPSGAWDASPLEGIDAVVHLAGESIGARIRWNAEAKQRILDSRVEGTRSLSTALAGLRRPPRVLLSASAAGYYGNHSDEPLDESARSGGGFLAEVCRQWEDAATAARDAGIRVVHPRLGIAIAAVNPAIKPMELLASVGALGPIGSGRQRVPVVSLHDATRALEHLITNDIAGPVNVVGPDTPTQRVLARTLASLKHRPSFLPVPSLAIRALLGQQGNELLLWGQWVVPTRLAAEGFRFATPRVADALAIELGLPQID